MKILLDSNSLQAWVHKQNYPKNPNGRISTFKDICKDCNLEPIDFSWTRGDLINFLSSENHILAILTRRPQIPFDKDGIELKEIKEFVEKGGCLLLMSNHGDFDERIWDCREQDNRLANKFDIRLEGPTFQYVIISNDNPITQEPHEITNGINSIVFNNSCRINISENLNATILATLPGESGRQNVFATAIDRQNESSGRVVIVADSGFIGDDNSGWPGPGLIEEGDNKKFLENILNWLKR
jgi:hypothetical protein